MAHTQAERITSMQSELTNSARTSKSRQEQDDHIDSLLQRVDFHLNKAQLQRQELEEQARHNERQIQNEYLTEIQQLEVDKEKQRLQYAKRLKQMEQGRSAGGDSMRSPEPQDLQPKSAGGDSKRLSSPSTPSTPITMGLSGTSFLSSSSSAGGDSRRRCKSTPPKLDRTSGKTLIQLNAQSDKHNMTTSEDANTTRRSYLSSIASFTDEDEWDEDAEEEEYDEQWEDEDWDEDDHATKNTTGFSNRIAGGPSKYSHPSRIY